MPQSDPGVSRLCPRGARGDLVFGAQYGSVNGESRII